VRKGREAGNVAGRYKASGRKEEDGRAGKHK